MGLVDLWTLEPKYNSISFDELGRSTALVMNSKMNSDVLSKCRSEYETGVV